MKFSFFQQGLRLYLLMLLISYCCQAQEMKEIFMAKELDLDTSLTNHCMRWRPKIPATISKMSKVRFGPFKIIGAGGKAKAKKVSDAKEKDIFWVTKTSVKSREASLIILYNEKDTVLVDLLFETTNQTERRSFFGRMIFGNNEDDKTSHWVECREMVIRLPGDTVSWHFVPNLKKADIGGGVIGNYGTLTAGSDSIEIGYAKGFKGVKRLWSGYPTGIIFSKDGRQLAASQFKYKQYVWLSAALEENTKMLLGSCILSLKCVEQE